MPLSPAAALRKDRHCTPRPKMTHQHFALIAQTVRDLQSIMTPDKVDETARRFANVLWYTNPNFDRARFLAACGVEE